MPPKAGIEFGTVNVHRVKQPITRLESSDDEIPATHITSQPNRNTAGHHPTAIHFTAAAVAATAAASNPNLAADKSKVTPAASVQSTATKQKVMPSGLIDDDPDDELMVADGSVVASTAIDVGHRPQRSVGGWTNDAPAAATKSPQSTEQHTITIHPSPSTHTHTQTIDKLHHGEEDDDTKQMKSHSSPNDPSLKKHHPPPHTNNKKKSVMSEFERELHHKFGHTHHKLAPLIVRPQPFFQQPALRHFLHKPQLKQYYRSSGQILVRQDSERKAMWAELMFDLVFICVFQRAAHTLHGSTLDGRALTEFSVLFCAAWKIWIDLTMYVNHFGPSDTLHKFYFILQMVFVMGLSVMSIRGVIGSYLAATGTTLLLRCWSSYYAPRAREDAKAQVIIWLLAAIPWLASLSVEPQHHDDGEDDAEFQTTHGRADYKQFELWGGGLFIAFLGQFLTQCHSRFHIPLNIEHITERFGIFTILCFGEQILDLLFSDLYASRDSFLMALLGGAVIFAVQTLYFDVDGFHHKMHALRGSRVRSTIWTLLHCPFHGAIIVSSVTFSFFVDSTLNIHSPAAKDSFEYGRSHPSEGYTVEGVFELGEEAIDASVEAAEHGSYRVQVITSAHRQLFSIANGTLVFVLFLIACLHVGHDHTLIRRRWRMIGRGVGTIAMFMLHLFGDGFTPLGMMAYAGLWLAALACIDVYGGYVPKHPKSTYRPNKDGDQHTNKGHHHHTGADGHDGDVDEHDDDGGHDFSESHGHPVEVSVISTLPPIFSSSDK